MTRPIITDVSVAAAIFHLELQTAESSLPTSKSSELKCSELACLDSVMMSIIECPHGSNGDCTPDTESELRCPKTPMASSDLYRVVPLSCPPAEFPDRAHDPASETVRPLIQHRWHARRKSASYRHDESDHRSDRCNHHETCLRDRRATCFAVFSPSTVTT